MANAMMATGKIIGTGADITVDGDKCGFRPKFIQFYNKTQDELGTWFDDFADGEIQTDSGFLTANGVTPADQGFTLGACAFNVADDEIFYVAFGV